MKNRYFGLRHGESLANVAGLVVIDPAIGTVDYGLTDNGRDQVMAAVRDFAELDATTLIHCSDFLRARETAELAATILECAAPMSDSRLRERFFGQWDMSTNTGYEEVWDMD